MFGHALGVRFFISVAMNLGRFEGGSRLFEEFSGVQVLLVHKNFQAKRFCRFRPDSQDPSSPL